MYRIVAITIGVAAGFMALPASAKPSTFQKTCNRVAVTATPEQVTLKASCQKAGGSPIVPASIELKGIANMPAGLVNTGEPHSSFQRSCTNIKVVTTPASAKLTATCQDGRGGTRQGMIEVENVHNMDGTLKIAS